MNGYGVTFGEGWVTDDSLYTCPITVEDVKNTRGIAFLNLSPSQQALCGGASGYIYQEGMRQAFVKGREEGLPEIDLSDSESYELFKIGVGNTTRQVGSVLTSGWFQPILWVLGIILGLNFINNLFDR